VKNYVVFASQRGGNWDIYRLTVDEAGRPQGMPEQLTTDPASDTTPVHSPDGQHIFFRSNRDAGWAVWVMNDDGIGQRRLILTDGSDAWNREKISVTGNVW
jgi:Tol biopolymer transport system component